MCAEHVSDLTQVHRAPVKGNRNAHRCLDPLKVRH
jgi:hypothetical protein